MKSSSVLSQTTSALHTSPQKERPSADEIRKRRLAKFAGEKFEAGPSETTEKTTTAGTKRAAEDDVKKPAAKKVAKTPEIIDLCDDSDDDEDDDDDDDDDSDAESVALLADDNPVEVAASSNNRSSEELPRNQQLAFMTEEEQIAMAIDLSCGTSEPSRNDQFARVGAQLFEAASRQVGNREHCSIDVGIGLQPPNTSNWDSWKRKGSCFQVVTYNLWFGCRGDGFPHPEARMSKVADLLLNRHSTQNPLWFAGFQEVVPSLSTVLFPKLQKAGYRIIQETGVPYGVALAIRQAGANDDCACPQIVEANFQPYRQSPLGRGFMYAHCRIPSPGECDEECIVATTHLESFCSKQYDGSKFRGPQILELQQFFFRRMQQHPNIKTAIIMGDLNWDDERLKNSPDPKLLELLSEATGGGAPNGQWKDAFLETNSDRNNKGYSYDTKLNPMFSGSLRRRLDRVLVFRPEDSDIILRQHMIGKDPLPGLTFDKPNTFNGTTREMPVAASDHFGLVTHLSTQAG